MKQISPSLAIGFNPAMLVVRWSELSATTATFSCCWSTGRGVTSYRFVLLCRWRIGMVLTCTNLGNTVCSQVLGAHALSGCYTVSYPFGKSKAFVLKALKACNFQGLFDVLGEESATHTDLVAVGQQFFAAVYGHPTGTSKTQGRYNLYTLK